MKRLLLFLKSMPKYGKILCFATAFTHFAAYYFPLVLAPEPVRVLSSSLDDAIPLVPGFVFIYVAAFIFWIVNYLLLYSMPRGVALRVFTADTLIKAAAVLVYFLCPCTINQPADITGFGAWALKIIYFCDEPKNLLPSMHCYVSAICAIGLFSRDAKGVSKFYRAFSVIFALLICASTLYTKQHVLADVYTGAGGAVAAWIIACVFWSLRERKH